MISSRVLSALMSEMIFVCTAPLLFVVVLRIRCRISFWPALAGIATYILFALELEGLVHTLVLTEGTQRAEYIISHPVLYVIYMGVLAILFEEGGRYVVFRFFLKQDDAKLGAVVFGVCFGGLEAIVSSGLGAFMNYTYASVINEIGIDEFRATLTELSTEEIDLLVNGINSITFGTCLLDILERALWILLHVELSIIVFYAVKRKRYNYLAADAVLRAISLVPAALAKLNVFSGKYTAFILEIVIVLIISYIAFHVYGSYDTDEDPFEGKEGIVRTLRENAAGLTTGKGLSFVRTRQGLPRGKD